jgi:arylsulfatase A-like enzyme
MKKVILLTIDCGRQDYIYGERAKTPHIDQLRRDGATFTEAFCQANYTIPSMVSIFSSSYLSDHKISNSSLYLRSLPAHYLPEYLRRQGRCHPALAVRPADQNNEHNE